jgi:hypothetical protein
MGSGMINIDPVLTERDIVTRDVAKLCNNTLAISPPTSVQFFVFDGCVVLVWSVLLIQPFRFGYQKQVQIVDPINDKHMPVQ